MTSPARRRDAVARVCRKLRVSERRACRALGQPRSSQRYGTKDDAAKAAKKEWERRLVERMLELLRLHPRYGYRRIWALLRRDGWAVNLKRVHRLWRREGLKVPRKSRKKRHLGHSANGCARLQPKHADHVWAWDFIYDRTENGRTLKWLSVVDEHTRECLALVVARSLRADDVIEELTELFQVRGVPEHLRSDNGPEFIAKALRAWLGAKTAYVAPGAPWENGYAESFHSRLRDELLNVEVFATVGEAKAMAEQWQLDYNHRRPHSSLGYQTPAEFAAGPAGRRKDRSATLRDPCVVPQGPKAAEPETPVLS